MSQLGTNFFDGLFKEILFGYALGVNGFLKLYGITPEVWPE